MKAEELRIGNLLLREGFANHIYIVKGIGHDAILRTDKGSMPIRGLHPIPLNEKWLKKLGFKKTADSISGYNEGWIFQNRKVVLKKADNRFWFYLSDTEDDWFYTTSIVIEYIHQLQNLYFALVGSELNLNQNEKP